LASQRSILYLEVAALTKCVLGLGPGARLGASSHSAIRAHALSLGVTRPTGLTSSAGGGPGDFSPTMVPTALPQLAFPVRAAIAAPTASTLTPAVGVVLWLGLRLLQGGVATVGGPGFAGCVCANAWAIIVGVTESAIPDAMTFAGRFIWPLFGNLCPGP
jgi:hypothetical protein